MLEADPSIEGIIVDRLDRSARNMSDFVYVVETLKRTVISAREGEFSPDDPAKLFQAFILIATSKLSSDFGVLLPFPPADESRALLDATNKLPRTAAIPCQNAGVRVDRLAI